MLSFLFGILTAVLILQIIPGRHDVPQPPPVVAADTLASIFADMPNVTASDFRKQASAVAAWSAVTELIEAEVLTEPDEILAAFRIETANLRTQSDWQAIQHRLELLLRGMLPP